MTSSTGMSEEGYVKKYCLVCDNYIQAYVSTSYGVGQHGGIVVAKTYCTICHCLLSTSVVDQDI